MNRLMKYGRYFLLFLTGSLTILALSSALGKIEAYYHSGRSLESAHPGFEVLRNDAPLLKWTSDFTQNSNEHIKKDIAKQYKEGWMWLNSSLGSGDWRGIMDYYTTPMAEDLKENRDSSATYLDKTILKHHLTLKHLSIDYTLAVFVDSLVQYQCAHLNQSAISCSTTIHTIEVYMQLQDDRWKVFNWKEISMEKESMPEKQVNPIFRENLKRLRDIKGINYYPQKSPWKSFWMDYNPTVINKDFSSIASLGFNTIRIFIGMRDLGRNEINQSTIANLDHLISEAKRHDLRLIPTLFDFPIGFEISKFPTYIRQLEFIVDRYKHDNTIMAWNLKNEADLDFTANGKDEVIRWADLMIDTYKQIDAQHPLTIGWANIENALILENKLDYISLHHYASITELKEFLETRELAEKPIVIEEFGIPSNKSIWNLYLHSESRQAKEIKTRIDFYDLHKLPWIIWTLYDFDEAPSDVFGKNPLARSKQKGFGILKVDGQKKSVVTLIENSFKR